VGCQELLREERLLGQIVQIKYKTIK